MQIAFLGMIPVRNKGEVFSDKMDRGTYRSFERMPSLETEQVFGQPAWSIQYHLGIDLIPRSNSY